MLYNQEFWESWGQTNSLYNNWASLRKTNYYILFVMYSLNSHNSITQKQICEYTGITKQTVNSVINELKKEEYIILLKGSDDKREKNIVLTEKGKDYANELLAPLYKIENNIFDIMGRERVKQMIESIALFNILFEKELKANKGVNSNE